MNKRDEYIKALQKFDHTDVANPITASLIADAVKIRSADVHKGRCGRLLVLGGSVGLTGAAIMATQSAQRCGCGLITLASAQELNTVFEIRLTEAMTCPLPSRNGAVVYEAKGKLLELSRNADAFLVGPGMSHSDDITRLVCELVCDSCIPLVIDADGLNAIAVNTAVLNNASAPVILTPHIGEFARLTARTTDDVLKNTEELAADFARRYNVILVLKSHRTIVVTPDGEIYRNVLGNWGMAKGGSGDVLSGCIASFAAQTGNMLLSAQAGVYFHSLSADMAVGEFGHYSLLPTDVSEYLRFAIKETYDDVNR